MKLYKRSDFIKLPVGTIYSRVSTDHEEFCNGLFCKTSGEEWENDWIEQDLIDEPLVPDHILDGFDCLVWAIEQRDSFNHVELDYNCTSRDGMFDDEDKLLVWDKKDIRKLINYLEECEEVAL